MIRKKYEILNCCAYDVKPCKNDCVGCRFAKEEIRYAVSEEGGEKKRLRRKVRTGGNGRGKDPKTGSRKMRGDVLREVETETRGEEMVTYTWTVTDELR